MNSGKIRNAFFLVATALIWGVAFVAQSTGGEAVGPYTFNCVRSLLGGIALLPGIALIDKLKGNGKRAHTKEEKRNLMTGGFLCGVALFLASTAQQMGMFLGTSAGKAGFLTACYILIVPVLGLFLKKSCGLKIWICVAITLAGLYMLCMNQSLALRLSDVLVLVCALIFSIHILIIDYFSPLVDGIRMSCIQFFVCGILGIVPMVFFEMGNSVSDLRQWARALGTAKAWIPILYAGILSCGVGYTLQIVGQKELNPTIASLLLSLESVFSVLAGSVILGETMTGREKAGCVMIFAAIIFAQIPLKKRKK